MSEFDAIRPYQDDEVRAVLNRLLRDREFLDALLRFRLPNIGRVAAPLFRSLVRKRLSRELAAVNAVSDLQTLMKGYLQTMLEKTVDTLTVTGLDHIDGSRAHLFISNHRDIAMDSAFVNWTLYKNGFKTLRIAIGDNLLTKPFASDLMRLNKSFIVNRSAKAPREKFKAAKLLSKYIYHSVVNDNENVWIAQREGRAKDGIDITNPAIISMLMLNRSKKEDFGAYAQELRIVPVSISYEYDPCDSAKAKEVFAMQTEGEYLKAQHEDVQSIAQGIVGYKGRVHLAFGSVIDAAHEDVGSIVKTLDKQICDNYVLHPTNAFAYEILEKVSPAVPIGEHGTLFSDMDLGAEREKFHQRLSACKTQYHTTFLQNYANPVYRKLNAAN